LIDKGFYRLFDCVSISVNVAERRRLYVGKGLGDDPWIARMAGSLNYCH